MIIHKRNRLFKIYLYFVHILSDRNIIPEEVVCRVVVSAVATAGGGGNQFHPECDGMAEAHIENKVLSNQRRVMGFWDTGHDPFVYAFLVRDNNE